MDELLRRARRGDGQAFAEIFGRFERGLYRVAWMYVRNEPDALDVMQEAAFRAFRSIRTLRQPEYARTWLTRIVINCALDRLRREGRLQACGVETVENDPRFATSFEGEALGRITLQGLLQTLTDEERQVILLRYFGEYTFAEMARLLNRPLGTVKTVLYRALNRLREQAKEELP